MTSCLFSLGSHKSSLHWVVWSYPLCSKLLRWLLHPLKQSHNSVCFWLISLTATVLAWRLLSSNEHTPVSFLTVCLWSPQSITLFQPSPRAETQSTMYQCCLIMRLPLSVSQKSHLSLLRLMKAFPLSHKIRFLSLRLTILILMCVNCLMHMS